MEKCNGLYLLRHGQSEWNRAGRHQGRLDSRLTGKGRDQAAEMGAILARELAGCAGITAVTSPTIRATETAEIALAPLAVAAVRNTRLVEVGLGDWEGLTHAQIAARWPQSRTSRDRDPFGWHFTAPGGERFDDICARLQEFADDLDQREGPVVIVAHGIALRVLRGLLLGLDRAGMAALPGGQGVVWRIADGQHAVLG